MMRRSPIRMLDEPYEPFLVHRVEERLDVGVQYEAHLLARRIPTQSASSASCVPRPGRNPYEIRRNFPRRSHSAARPPPVGRSCPPGPRPRAGAAGHPAWGYRRAGTAVPDRSSLDPVMQVLDLALEVCLVVPPRQPISARRGVRLEFVERLFEQVGADMVEERGEPLLLPLPCDFPYAFQRL